MYQQEDIQHFDSWFQDDMNHMTKKLALTILSGYNFNSVVDFGCGKGTFTNLLKKNNNNVIGVDISETAILKAKAKYPFIDFQVGDAGIFSQMPPVDLVVAIEVFSYVENWKEIFEMISKRSSYFFIAAYIPPSPIGFIKSMDELEKTLTTFFRIESKMVVNNESSLFFVKSL
jgi:trans-aconitate methyltransferase